MPKEIKMGLGLLFFIQALSTLSAEPQTLLYRSNALAMELAEITADKKSQFEYVLAVTKYLGREERILYYKQQESDRWVSDFYPDGTKKQETVYTNGNVSKISDYSREGRLLKETNYQSGQKVSSTEYTYDESGLLLKVTSFTADSSLLRSEEYFYTKSGRLREVRITFPSGEFQVYAYVYGEGRLWQEKTIRGAYFYLTEYDKLGRITKTQVWLEGNLVLTDQLFYDGSGVLVKQKTEDLEKNTVIERVFDSQGRIVQEQFFSSFSRDAERTITYSYDETGRLAKKRSNGPQGAQEWTYAYDSDDKIREERYYQQGLIIKITSYTSETEYREEFFKQGILFLRVYYVKNEKNKEEFLKDGKVILVKEYGVP